MDMTWDHLYATLTSLMELELYALYLCSSPQRAACLLVDPKDDAETKQLQCTVLHDMRDEWKMIQEMEAKPRDAHVATQGVPLCFLPPLPGSPHPFRPERLGDVPGHPGLCASLVPTL